VLLNISTRILNTEFSDLQLFIEPKTAVVCLLFVRGRSKHPGDYAHAVVVLHGFQSRDEVEAALQIVATAKRGGPYVAVYQRTW